MRFGIVSPATPDVPTHAAIAESLGFETGWLFDSHMVYSDVYVIMALCSMVASFLVNAIFALAVDRRREELPRRNSYGSARQ